MSQTYTGHVQNGVIVLDDGSPPWPEGTRVRVEAAGPSPSRTLADRLAGRLARVRSGGSERLSEDCGAKLAEHLARSHAAGEAPSS